MASSDIEICNLALSRLGADTITSLTADATKEDRLCNQFYAQFRDELLRSFAWNFAVKSTPLNLVDGYETDTAYTDKISITNVATSNPIIVTAANNYATGQIVKLWDVGGTEELNDQTFEVTGATALLFKLLGVDGGKFSTYTSGGYAIRQEPMASYALGYTYVLPTDCLKALKLDSGVEFEIFGDEYNTRRLLTIDYQAVLIYISKVTDVSKFPDDFVQALVSRLARELAMPLLGAKDGAVVRRELSEDLKQAMSVGRKNNCHEQAMKYSYKSTWATARK
jgi:hypothetical protein